jgi:hypothetical protein
MATYEVVTVVSIMALIIVGLALYAAKVYYKYASLKKELKYHSYYKEYFNKAPKNIQSTIKWI